MASDPQRKLSAYFKRHSSSASLPLPAVAQFAQAGVNCRLLEEVPVGRLLRKLQLLDGRSELSLQQ
jgi:hypothetical protein